MTADVADKRSDFLVNCFYVRFETFRIGEETIAFGAFLNFGPQWHLETD